MLRARAVECRIIAPGQFCIRTRAHAICDRVCVLYRGERVAEGVPMELRAEADMPGSSLEEVFLKLTEAGDVKEIVDALSE